MTDAQRAFENAVKEVLKNNGIQIRRFV